MREEGVVRMREEGVVGMREEVVGMREEGVVGMREEGVVRMRGGSGGDERGGSGGDERARSIQAVLNAFDTHAQYDHKSTNYIADSRKTTMAMDRPLCTISNGL